MTVPVPSDLILLTIREPAQAARLLTGLNLSGQVLWTAMFLVAVLQALVIILTEYLFPLGFPMSALAKAPFWLFVASLIGLVLMVFALHWIGQQMGGQGTLHQIIVVILWLQLLRIGVQLITLGLAFVSPILATLVSFCAGLLAIYIIIQFINQVHNLDSVAKSIAVLALSMLATMIGLSVLIAMVGAPLLGTIGHV